jgi:hypothetical protein
VTEVSLVSMSRFGNELWDLAQEIFRGFGIVHGFENYAKFSSYHVPVIGSLHSLNMTYDQAVPQKSPIAGEVQKPHSSAKSSNVPPLHLLLLVLIMSN